jgi:hypothetical protein
MLVEVFVSEAVYLVPNRNLPPRDPNCFSRGLA